MMLDEDHTMRGKWIGFGCRADMKSSGWKIVRKTSGKLKVSDDALM